MALKMKSLSALQPSKTKARFKKGMKHQQKVSRPAAKKAIMKASKKLGRGMGTWR